MRIKQWENKHLSHFSYAILSEDENSIVLVDPGRNPEQYYEYAKKHDAKIIGVIETHPHADFVSGHLEIQRATGASIYASELLGPSYSYQKFDDGNTIQFGEVKLIALNTPGHSPDSISIVAEEKGVKKAIFTGDTLFIGDCGRPDLREGVGNVKATREELARRMYYSLREKIMTLPDEVEVYPAHGAGSLCGKSLSEAHRSTIGSEKSGNWSLQPMEEDEFVRRLIADQPFIPAYFSQDVELNRKGAPDFRSSVESVPIGKKISEEKDANRLQRNVYIIDIRPEHVYKKGFLKHSINLMEGSNFETWLGTMIKPGEPFYLAASKKKDLKNAIERIASIGYEAQVLQAFVVELNVNETEALDINEFEHHQEKFTIIDVRNRSEANEKKIFSSSISIPLNELRSRIDEVPTDKPIVVHCAAGYRSAAASSLIKSELNGNALVFDLGKKIKKFT